MSRFHSQFERLEFKYLVDEGTAERVRRSIEPYCRPDPHNRREGGGVPGYSISTLYLDTPGLAFYEAKERGDAERWKLRVRRYPGVEEGGEGDPIAVPEIKRRVADVIDKTRAVVALRDVETVAAGHPLRGPRPRPDRFFLSRFARMVAESGAEPKVHVAYEREAYASFVDHYARVTFDREIRACWAKGWALPDGESAWLPFEDCWGPELSRRAVVLELKCQSRVPDWLGELVQRFALKRVSFSKYSMAVHALSERDGAQRVPRRSAKLMRWRSPFRGMA